MPTTANSSSAFGQKTAVIFSSIMANAFFIGMRFPHWEDVPAVHLLCTPHWRWALSSFSAPILLGMFWSLLSKEFFSTGHSPMQSAHKLLASFCGPLFSHLTEKKGWGTADLSFLWMPLSDPKFKAMLPVLRCVGKAQREYRHGYLVLEEMILENYWLCCMKQSIPQASALSEYSIDVRISVFSAASKITFFQLLAGCALILVNSGERKNDLRPLISSFKDVISLQLYILYFSTSVRLNMHIQTSNSLR